MAKLQTEFHTLILNGIEYSIKIEPCDPGDYVGRWRCLTCNCEGGTYSTFHSTEDTLRIAKFHLKIHHSDTHARNELKP